MTFLIAVLCFKIFVTLVVVIYPAFFRPVQFLNQIFATDLTNAYLFRLYGVAVLALLVAYGYGVYLATVGIFPWGILFMGLVSNGGASWAMLALPGWRQQRAAILLFGGIFVALFVAGLLELA